MYWITAARRCAIWCVTLALCACGDAQLPMSAPPAAVALTSQAAVAAEGAPARQPAPTKSEKEQLPPRRIEESITDTDRTGGSRLYHALVARRDELSQAREKLAQYGSTSDRSRSVSLSLRVLDAMSAPSEAVYRQRMNELPVTIHRNAERDQLGRDGLVTEYWVKGKKWGSRFEPTTPEWKGPSETSSIDGGPSATSLELARSEYEPCTYTNEDGTWAGECATQQDIDDGWTQLAALDSDLGSVQSDQAADVEYCRTVLNSCWETEAAPALEPDYSFDGPSGYGGSGTGPCAPVRSDCTSQAVAATSAGVTAVVRMSLAGAALSAAGVSVVALAATTGLAAGSLSIFGYFAYQLYVCVYAT